MLESKYRYIYESAVESAERLPADILNSISAPQPFIIQDEYLDSDQRIMILGQETYGLTRPIVGKAPAKAYEFEISSAAAFDMAEGGSAQQRSSPFWRAFRQVCDYFDLAAPKGIAWSNLFKVQGIGDVPATILRFSKEQRYKILTWQKPLFDAELALAAPKRILLFTGPVYEFATDFLFEGLAWQKLEGQDTRDIAIAHCPDRDLVLVRTYHPKFLQMQNKWHLIEVACNALKSG